MSEGALFAWGAVIFFVVGTGGFLYGLAVTRERFEQDNQLPSWGSE